MERRRVGQRKRARSLVKVRKEVSHAAASKPAVAALCHPRKRSPKFHAAVVSGGSFQPTAAMTGRQSHPSANSTLNLERQPRRARCDWAWPGQAPKLRWRLFCSLRWKKGLVASAQHGFRASSTRLRKSRTIPSEHMIYDRVC